MDNDRSEEPPAVAGKGLLVPVLAYFAMVFAIGFALGTLRVLLIVPRFGEMIGVWLELPIILVSAWLVCRWAMRRWAVPRGPSSRLFVGLAALAMLLAAEVLLGLTLFGRDLAGQLAEMTRGSGALGLAAQLVYAFFPLLQARSE